MLQHDEWLSAYFQPLLAYRFQYSPNEISSFPDGFISAKISANDVEGLNYLLSNGFYIVENTLLFQQVSESHTLDNQYRFHLRETCAKDSEQVAEISAGAFVNSRFYQDSNIAHDVAADIKHDWVLNFYIGARGTKLLVSEADNGDIAGFILLIDQTIDLIATSPHYLQKGVASELIQFAGERVGPLTAGTQSVNKASIQLYCRNGFQVKQSAITLHRFSSPA